MIERKTFDDEEKYSFKIETSKSKMKEAANRKLRSTIYLALVKESKEVICQKQKRLKLTFQFYLETSERI